MPEPRSDSLFHSYYKSSEQFDYFMLALSGGVVAYLAQNVPVSRFSSASYDIYLIAVVALLFAVYCGFRRIEISNVCKRLNAKALHLAEKRGKLKEALNSLTTGRSVLNTETGEAHSAPEIMAMIDEISKSLPTGDVALKKQQNRSLQFYKLRNRLFFLGVVGVLLAKVLSPYIG